MSIFIPKKLEHIVFIKLRFEEKQIKNLFQFVFLLPTPK